MEDPDEDPAVDFARTSGTWGCSGGGWLTTAHAATCGSSGLKLEPEPECDLRVCRSRPLSVVRRPSLSTLASRSRSLTPTLPMPSPTFPSGLKLPSGLPVLRLSRSENDAVRVILRPRGCSTCAWEDNDGEDAERPREKPGSDGTRKGPLAPWAGVLARGTAVAGLEEAALVDAMIAAGEGVRERDLLRDLEREVDRGMSG